jgi:hypothetical protein
VIETFLLEKLSINTLLCPGISCRAYAPTRCPVHPGAAPNHPAGATAPQITEINRQFLADQKEFALYISVAANLKRQLIKAVPAIYLAALRDPINNFSRVSVLNILDHLDTTYGTITSDDLAKNLQNMHREWSSTQPLEALWDNINQCRHMALALDPISDRAAVQAALDNLDRSGVFIDAVKFWRLRPEVDRTYANIRAHFTLADLERQRELTAKSAGYHGTALAATGNTQGPPATIVYCWTHGCNVHGKGHNSADCTKRATGHNPAATYLNMLGGNNTIRRLNNEKPIFKPRVFAAAAVATPSDPAAPVETTPPVTN